MKTPASLTGRLILWLSLGTALLWLAGVLAGSAILSRQLDFAFDGGLRETAERLLALASEGLHDREEGEGERRDIPLFETDHNEYIVYQVLRGDGTLIIRSHDAPETPFDVPLAAGFSTSGGWRVFTIGGGSHGLFIHVAESRAHRADALYASLAALILPIAAVLPLSAIGIFLVVRAGLAPLRAFSAEISRRDARNLAPIETAPLPRELRPTADAVQALIARLAAAFEAERALAANSAHELRTPIAGSLAQTQRLIAELHALGSPAEPRARQVEESLHRLRRLSEKLLQLARADAGMAAAAAPVELLPALELLVDDARRALPAPGRLSLAIAPGATLLAPLDVDAFGIALRNLIENAVLHGPPGGPIAIAVPEDNVVTVTNGGPAIAAAALPLLTRRFERGETRAAGSGLGLAIVEQLIVQAGGRLELISPAPGRAEGFCARVTLPEA